AGMVRDHDHGAVRRQAIAEHGEGTFQYAQLVVHRDAQRLEQRRKLRRTASWPECRANGADEIVAGDERAITPSANDFSREAPRARFISVFLEHANELVLVAVIEYARGIGFRFGTH